MNITWLGHTSIKLDIAGKTIYIDPYAGDDEWYQKGDVVLVSQWHYDHCSLEKVKRIGGRVIGTPEVASQIHPSHVLRPGESVMLDDMEIVAMPVAHDYIGHRGHDHDEQTKLGFVIIAEEKKVYYMGGSDYMTQLQDMRPDVLLIAVGGIYSAGPQKAAESAKLINPKLAIPVHWGTLVGSRDDAELFAETAGVPVTVLKEGETITA